MIRFLVAGFIILPIIEIALFVKVGQTIGLFPTLALVIGAGILGVAVLRLQGLAVLSQMRSTMSAGQMPARSIADAMMIGVAGFFLILPGFLSDIVALTLLIPGVRGWIYHGLASRLVVVGSAGAARGPAGSAWREDRVAPPKAIDLDEDDYRPR